jgi:hypothetical protein
MKFCLDEEYMSESYDQARRHGSKWLLAERLVGSGFILLGIGLYLYARGMTFLPLALVIIGGFELLSNRIKKFFWLRRHAKSKLNGAQIELEVSEAGIDSSSPFSTAHLDWSGIEKVVRTPKGILVWPQKGVYWYLPERIAGQETIRFIESKVG